MMQPVDSDRARYRATETILGKGSHGKVHEAYDEITGSPCVVKINLGKTEVARNEAAALGNLRGTHAVGLRASFPGLPHPFAGSPNAQKKDDHYSIVMDKANGQPLNKIQSCKLKELISIWKQLLEYLVSLEDRKLVHYDLKPDNLFWDKPGRKLTVLDHGSVRTCKQVYPDGPRTGEAYQAPEFFLSQRFIGKSVYLQDDAYDMWTVGCIIYCFIVGNPLFPKLSQKIMQADPNASYFHIKLQQIVEQLGPPSRVYLNKCPNPNLYFNEDLSLKVTYELPKTQNWQEALAASCEKYRFPESLKTKLIHVFRGIFCYENRIKPRDLLKDLLFKEELTVNFLFDRQKPFKLYLKSASNLQKPLEELTPADFPEMDLTIDLKTYKHSTLHVPFGQQYILFLESPQGIVKELITLNEGQTLDISELQAKLGVPTRTTRKALFDELDKATEPQEKKSKQKSQMND